MKIEKRESLHSVAFYIDLLWKVQEGVAVKELKAMLLCGVFYQSGSCSPAFITRIMFPSVSSTGSAWSENEREAGSGLFSFHTGPKQNTCQRKTYCFLLSYLIPSPTSSISKLSESSNFL